MATMHQSDFSEPSFGPTPILLGPPDLVEAYYWLGGHFAAWEEPQLFSQELRAAFRSLR